MWKFPGLVWDGLLQQLHVHKEHQGAFWGVRICCAKYHLFRVSWYRQEIQQTLERVGRAFGEASFRFGTKPDDQSTIQSFLLNTKSISGWDQGWLEAQNKRGALNGQLWTQLQWEPMVPHIRPPTIPWPQVSRWSAKHNEHLIFTLVSPRYTVFGKVIDGWDTLDELERIPVNPKNHRPLKGVEATINGVTIHANPMAG